MTINCSLSIASLVGRSWRWMMNSDGLSRARSREENRIRGGEKKMYRKARSKLYIFSKTRDDYEFTDAWKCLAQCSGSLTMFAALISFLLNAHDSSARTERVECYVKFAHKTVENYETINPSRYLTFQYLSPCATATLWASQSTIKSHKFRLIFPLLGFLFMFWQLELYVDAHSVPHIAKELSLAAFNERRETRWMTWENILRGFVCVTSDVSISLSFSLHKVATVHIRLSF